MAQTIAGTPLSGQAPGQTPEQLAAQRMQEQQIAAQQQQQMQAIQAEDSAQAQIVHEFKLVSRGNTVYLYKDGQMAGNAMRGYEDILLRNEGLTSSDVLYKNGVLIQEGGGVAAARATAQARGMAVIARHERIAEAEAQEAAQISRIQAGVASGELRGAGKAPIGVEAAKEAEALSAKELQISPALKTMLTSPTAQFASQEVAQKAYDIVSRRGHVAPEDVQATLKPQLSYTNVYGTQTIGQPSPAALFGEPVIQAPPTAFHIAKAQLEARTAEFYRPKQTSLITGMPLVKTTYEYTTQPPTVSEFSIFGFPVGKQIPLEEGKTYTLPSLFGKVQVASEGIPTKKATERDIKVSQILGMGVGLTAPTIGVFRTTSSLMGAKVVFPKIFPKTYGEFVKSEEAKVDIWGKIPTMRESAAKRGEILTRKIEFGSKFIEPTGKGVEIMSGRQRMIAIQEQKPLIVYESPIRKGGGYVAGQKGMKAQASILEKLAQRQMREVEIQRTSIQIITPVVGLIPSQRINKVSITRQKPEAISVQIQKPIQITPTIQKPIQIPISLVRQVPTQTQKQAPAQALEITAVQIPKIQSIFRPVELPREIVRERPTTEKPPRERLPEIPKIPIILFPGIPSVDILGITKKKKRLKTKKTVTITPYATIEDMFNISSKKKNVSKNNSPKLDILNIRKKRS